MLDRERAVLTIRAFGEELERGRREGPASGTRPRVDEYVREAFARACAHNDVSVEEMQEALAHDPSLRELEDAVEREVLLGSVDPGPYDVISRESSSGSEDNNHLDTDAARFAFPKTIVE